MSDLNKMSAVRNMQSMAETMKQIDDNCRSMQLLIIARNWDTTGAPTDEDLLELGIQQGDVVSFVGLMAAFNTLMAGNNRKIVDAMRTM